MFYNGTYRVRVGSFETADAASKSSAAANGSVVSGGSRGVLVVKAGTDQILFGFDCGSTKSLTLAPQNGGGAAITQVAECKYRSTDRSCTYYGDFQFTRFNTQEPQKLTLVNFVDLESYVKGVVPYEMSSGWPIEALKAQAVCARTYAASHMNGLPAYGFDITATTTSQVYLGTIEASANSDRAVDETAGKFVRYQGKLCETFFFAADGGATEDSENVWVAEVPYLRGVIDPYEKDIDFYCKSWGTSVSRDAVGDISVTYTPIGNVMTVTVGGKTYSKDNVRTFLTKICGLRYNSRHFTVEYDAASNVYNVVGGGYGHNCGMSQWGAKAMAEVHGKDLRRDHQFLLYRSLCFMKKSDFYFDLPEELIAQTPLERRDASRLLTLDKTTGAVEHHHFYELPQFLRPNDCLILNDSRVLPARLLGHRSTGGAVEVLLLRDLGDGKWECLTRPGRKTQPGTALSFGDGELTATVVDAIADGNKIVQFHYEGIFLEVLERLGKMPLPPYIKAELQDQERYQTVYSRELGSAAAPTAGLHFTKELLQQIADMGVRLGYVTLHVGLGTFRPVKEDEIEDHPMHSEFCIIPEETARIVNETKASGGRVICVGTTSCRTVESFAEPDGTLRAQSGWTDIFIYPGYKFKCLDALVTNFHLPESTLIMLVSALAGREHILNAYKIAVENRYRFFSFGDAMLIADL